MLNHKPIKKFGLGLVLVIFSFVTIAGSIGFARPAQAQFAVTTLSDIPRMAEEIVTKIKEGWKVALMSAAQRAVSYFMRKVAYDSAVWLASGGKGQTPFAEVNSFGDYMKNVGGDTFGEAIAALGKPMGLDLCKVPDIKVDLAIKIGLRVQYEGVARTTDCNWANFKKGWGKDAWQSKYGSLDALQKQFNLSLKADPDSDLGIYLKSTTKIDNMVTQRTESAKLERQEGQGFKNFTSLISNTIKTPAQIQKQAMEANTPEEQNKKSEAQVAAAFGSGMFQVLPSTIATFLNTLAGQMVKNYRDYGMLPGGLCIGSYGGEHCKTAAYEKMSASVYESSGYTVGGRDAAQAIFSEFLVANVKELDDYNILAELENCPDDAPSTYNCRADGYFIQAIQESNYDKPITIAEALEKKWIHPSWRLLNKERPENLDKKCKDYAYCFANIAVLRQLRILPLGFEIAAQNSPSDNPWTVEQVVNGFNSCNPNGQYDPVNFPFCHLIDPNWVLKIEPTRCNAFVNSSQPLISEGPDRKEDCVDLSSCVSYNKDGTCLSYSYCMREKNVWTFNADKCDSYYSTCKAFTDSNGDSVAYLYRTLDTSHCNADTSGCAAFSLNKDDDGNWLDVGVNKTSQYFSNGIHFNSNLSTSCGSNSFGCSAFVTSTVDSGVLYLRKAPDYLNCYDTNLATPEIDWPQNNADLSKLKPKTDCSLYSAVCTAMEEGCNLFTSLLTGEDIPGKFKPAVVTSTNSLIWNDQCDSRCDGYAAYREMPNNYSNGRNIAYIIPSSGSACSAADEGCSSFTNMGETYQGGEKIEYYSYLRPCIKPDIAKQKNFYTYEGNKDGGYQLKSYTLEKDVNGSPKYWYKVISDLADYNLRCNAAIYKAGLADPDCRQFNDESGNIYYALLGKTIAVSDSCNYYRLNSPERNIDGSCFQNGIDKDGFCYYYGLPSGITTSAGTSRDCSASAVSCAAYKGNAGNNVKLVINDKFEDTNYTLSSLGWSANSGNIAYSSESTHYGEHSLSYTGTANLTKTVNLSLGKTYIVSFWAKGDEKNISLKMGAGADYIDVGKFDTSDTWQYYSFNPTELSGTTSVAELVFSFFSGRNFFLDNLRITEVTSYLYLVRDSLKVDPICDSNLNDNLPGEALGCTGYKVTNSSDTFYLTNFSYLCRNEAVGCTALLDTYNTLSNTNPDAYNVWISGGSGTRSITIDEQSFSCVVPTGETGCYTDISGFTKSAIESAGGVFDASTVYIPADTPSTTPMYLVANAKSACNSADLGCTYAGAKTITPSGVQFTTTTIKNDPASYQKNLCESQAVGCNAYSIDGGNYYFKDPNTTGQKVCTYKSGIYVNGTLTSGWFWKDVGTCKNSSGINCKIDSDCGSNDQCQNIGQIPCYNDYIDSKNNYGLWSFGDKGKYENFVGECSIDQSGCTTFVDNNDKDSSGNGKSYYLINNNKLTQDNDCDGLVSQKAGCVLFDQVDKPGKLWDTLATYNLSESKGSEKVAPISGSDANVILKVTRNRECGEWLTCRSSHRTWNELEGKWNTVCDYIDRCNGVPESAQDESPCASYVDKNNDPYANKVLSQRDYVQRNTAWSGMDFSGFYILGMYQADELEQKNISRDQDNPDWRLVKKVTCGNNSKVCSAPSATNKYNFECKLGAQDQKCGFNEEGVCKNGLCVQNQLGTTDFITQKDKMAVVCRAYPEKDSPFPFTTAVKSSKLFNGANLCSEIADATKDYSKALACDCDYTKAVYGDFTTKYFNFNSPNLNETIKYYPGVEGTKHNSLPNGICQNGDRSGYACDTDSDCGENNTCQKLTKANRLLGVHGYCLEKDLSRNLWSDPEEYACLSWYPVDTILGYNDVNSQNQDAGFVQSSTGRYYCVNGSGLATDVNQTGTPNFEVLERGYEDLFASVDELRERGYVLKANEGLSCFDADNGDKMYPISFSGSIDFGNVSCDGDELKWVDDSTINNCTIETGGGTTLTDDLSINNDGYWEFNSGDTKCYVHGLKPSDGVGLVDSNNVSKGSLSCKKGVIGSEGIKEQTAVDFIQANTRMGCEQNCGLDTLCYTHDGRTMPYDEPVYGGEQEIDPRCNADTMAALLDDCETTKLKDPQNKYDPDTVGTEGYKVPNKHYKLEYSDYQGDNPWTTEDIKTYHGNWFYRIVVDQTDTDNPDYNCGNSARVFWPASRVGERLIYQSDIEYVKFELVDGDKEDPVKNTPIFVYPNEYYAGDSRNASRPLMSFETGDSGKGVGKLVIGNFSGAKNLPGFFFTSCGADGDKCAFNENGEFISSNWSSEDENATYRLNGNLFGQMFYGTTQFTKPIAFFEGEKMPSVNICKSGPDNQNWHGVVMHFDSQTKQFLGYWMFYCDKSAGQGFAKYKVTFKLRENCRKIADTTVDYVSPDNRDGAVAMTNVLWNVSKTKNAPVFEEIGYKQDTFVPPFGSFGVSSLDVFDVSLADGKKLVDKMVYMSSASVFELCQNDTLKAEAVYDGTEEGGYFTSCKVNSDVTQDSHIAGGAPYSCAKPGMCSYVGDENGNSIFSKKILGDSYRGFAYLNNVFVKLKGLYVFDYQSTSNRYFKGYTTVTDAGQNTPINQTYYKATNAQAPRVLAVYTSPGSCDTKGRCLEGDDGLTINDTYDKNVVIKALPASAVMKFFAYADADHMPLRNIKVDWGDGTTAGKYETPGTAYYANQRGLVYGECNTAIGKCQNVEEVTEKVCDPNDPTWCEEDVVERTTYYDECTKDSDCRMLPVCVPEDRAPDFGHIEDRSCDNNYFLFKYTYNCSKNSSNWKPGAGDNGCPDSELASQYGGCCVYTPRVQVKDNWGWCNGNNGNGGYYDSNDDPNGDNECDGNLFFLPKKAYQQFKYKVLVAPKD